MLAIVPARAGSKGLPRKNSKIFHGLPMIIHTLNAALKSELVERVIISTDDDEIISICSGIKGVEIPFKRPTKLALDNSIVTDTFFHLFEWLRFNEGDEPKNFCVLQPTSPLRLPCDIDGAIDLYNRKNADVVLSVYRVKPMEWYHNLNKEDKMESINSFGLKKNGMLSRQSLGELVLQNGAVHVFNTEKLKKNKTYYTKKTFGFLMPYCRSIDIDNEFDFFLAEKVMEDNRHLLNN